MGRFDLLGVVVGTVVATAATLALPASPIKTALVVPLLLFLPGYALTVLVFPVRAEVGRVGEDGDEEPVSEPTRDSLELEVVDRLAVAVGASVALVPAVALVANFTPFGLREVPVLVGVAGLTLLLAGAAAVRQYRLPANERFGLPRGRTGSGFFERYFSRNVSSLESSRPFEARSRSSQLLNVLLVVSVLFLVGSVGVAYGVSMQGQSFTEFYLASTNETGDLVATDYPQELTDGTEELYAVVENDEGERVQYTVVVEHQRVERTDDGIRVLEAESIGRFERTVAPGGEARIGHDPNPAVSGDRTRVVYLLYQGDPPADPSTQNAYRYLQLWTSADGN